MLVSLGIFLAMRPTDAPTSIEVVSSSIERKGDEVVCRVSLRNLEGRPSKEVRLSVSSTVCSKAVASTLSLQSKSFHRGAYYFPKLKGIEPAEMVIRFQAESDLKEVDLLAAKLNLTFLSYGFGEGKGEDFDEPLEFKVTFDRP